MTKPESSPWASSRMRTAATATSEAGMGVKSDDVLAADHLIVWLLKFVVSEEASLALIDNFRSVYLKLRQSLKSTIIELPYMYILKIVVFD